MKIAINHHLAIPFYLDRTGDLPLTEIDGTVSQFDNGKITAAVVYNNWRGGKIEGSIAVAPNHRLHRKFIACMFHMPMVYMDIPIVVARVRASNRVSREFLHRLGFKLAGVSRKGHPSGEDMMIFEMSRAECAWLKLARRYGLGD